MSILTDSAEAPVQRGLDWCAILGGTVIASGIAFALHGFAAALGIGVGSSEPTWRDASAGLWLLMGVYLIATAAASYGVGGYFAGRMRVRGGISNTDEAEFRDGAHGAAVWGAATLLTALMITVGAHVMAAVSAAEEGTAAEQMFAYEIDEMYRTIGEPQPFLDYYRAEAGRILMTAGDEDGVSAEDRTYLASRVEERAGISPEAAAMRVNTAIARAEDSLAGMRTSGVIFGFFAGAAAFLGLAIAWTTATWGGNHRESKSPPVMYVGRRRVTVVHDVTA